MTQEDFIKRYGNIVQEQLNRELNAVKPLRFKVIKERWDKRKKRIEYTIYTFDANDKEISQFTVRNQKVKNKYEWSCECGKAECIHIVEAKRIYFKFDD
jgi:hypothetical protein